MPPYADSGRDSTLNAPPVSHNTSILLPSRVAMKTVPLLDAVRPDGTASSVTVDRNEPTKGVDPNGDSPSSYFFELLCMVCKEHHRSGVAS